MNHSPSSKLKRLEKGPYALGLGSTRSDGAGHNSWVEGDWVLDGKPGSGDVGACGSDWVECLLGGGGGALGAEGAVS